MDGVCNKVTGQQYKKGDQIEAERWNKYSWVIRTGEDKKDYLIPNWWAKEVK